MNGLILMLLGLAICGVSLIFLLIKELRKIGLIMLFIGIILLFSGIERCKKPHKVDESEHRHHPLTIKDVVNGAYEVCVFERCVSPYGGDEVSYSHDTVEVVDKKFVGSKRWSNFIVGSDFDYSWEITETNCDYSFTVIKFLYPI